MGVVYGGLADQRVVRTDFTRVHLRVAFSFPGTGFPAPTCQGLPRRVHTPET